MIGKTDNSNLNKLIEIYRQRVEHYVGFEMIIAPDIKNGKNLTLDQQKEKEAELLLSKLNVQEEVILLDEHGKHFTSLLFADFISERMLYSGKNITFVIGGAYGFAEKMHQRANGLLSLSAMTFSHQMIRLLFVEQLYRAMTIIKGEPYHHE